MQHKDFRPQFVHGESEKAGDENVDARNETGSGQSRYDFSHELFCFNFMPWALLLSKSRYRTRVRFCRLPTNVDVRVQRKPCAPSSIPAAVLPQQIQGELLAENLEWYTQTMHEVGAGA